MCFRPNEIHRTNSDAGLITCPTCGMPVEFTEGTTEGVCPYCGDYIPPNPEKDFIDPKDNCRIL